MNYTVKKFKDFINESYRDLRDNDFNDKYDEKFANYALNERPFYLSDNDAEECKQIYGNRNVGIVYHGGKIDTQEQLEYLESLKNGDFINFKFKSATPYYDDAESFAFYVKSYDEYTMASQMRITMNNGAAGEFGGYVVKLKPKPEQVIISTFGEGKKPSMCAETECILKGEIEILDIKIFKPLNKETYLDDISKLEPNQLFNSFIKHWISWHKLPRPDKNFILNILNKLKTEKEAISFLLKYQKNYNNYIFNYIGLDEFLSIPLFERMIKDIKLKDGMFVLELLGEDFNVYLIKDMKNYILEKRKNDYLSFYKSIENLPYKVDNKNGYLYIDDNGAKILTILNDLNSPLIAKKCKILNDINKIIEEFLKNNVIGKSLNDMSVNEIDNVEHFFRRIKDFHFLRLVKSDIILKACQWYYNDMGRGIKDSRERKFDIYKDGLVYVITLMGKLK